MVSMLPYEDFLRYLDGCVVLIDNWALCDSFKGKCIAQHKQEFLPVLEKYFQSGKEFYQRYVLVSLLSFYVEEEYLNTIFDYLQRADTSKYYVHMACAWLTAEILIKQYEFGVYILRSGILDGKTHNKSIQKARESFRLKNEQKEFLNSLKIK
jgi:3-methyladenine DNA glycosylase AlkD